MTHNTLISRLFKDSDEGLETVHSYAKPRWKSIIGWWKSNSLEMDLVSVAGGCGICPYISTFRSRKSRIPIPETRHGKSTFPLDVDKVQIIGADDEIFGLKIAEVDSPEVEEFESAEIVDDMERKDSVKPCKIAGDVLIMTY
jgi:hypothetical protein